MAKKTAKRKTKRTTKRPPRSGPAAIANRIVGHGSISPRRFVLNPKNWRTHPGLQKAVLVDLLEEVGWVQTVIVNKRSGLLLDGHLRVKIAAERKELKVPVSYVDLSPAEEALVLATLDPIGALAGTNQEAHLALVAEMEAGTAALANLMGPDAGKSGTIKADESKPKKFATDALKKWKVKPHQVWRAGPHVIACEDCQDASRVRQLLGEAGKGRVVLLSDPPYCSGSFQEAGKAAGTWGDIASDGLSAAGYSGLMTAALTAARPHTAYMMTDWRMWTHLFGCVEACGLSVRSMIVWDKGHPGLGGLWRPQHELVIFGSRAGAKREKGMASVGNVITGVPRSGNKKHYTEKPVELFRRLLENDASGGRGSCLVYDPFAGSGTACLAADILGRPSLAIDVEPLCVAAALERIESETVHSPKLVKLRRP